jgi:hypothetical protein
MSSRRLIVVVVAACALTCAAVGAADASASGLTAVKCVKVAEGTGQYNNSHCETPEAVGSFETVPLPLHERTELEGEAIGTPVVTATIAGLKLQTKCGTADSKGGLENVEEGGEMRIHGTTELTFTECHAALASKPSRLCDVEGVKPVGGKGTVPMNPLTGITGPEHKVTLAPVEGEVFTEFTILTTGTECFFKTPVPVKVTGSVIAIANTEKHSHVTFTPATNGGNLKANGSVVSMEATIDGWMKGEPEVTVGAKTF